MAHEADGGSHNKLDLWRAHASFCCGCAELLDKLHAALCAHAFIDVADVNAQRAVAQGGDEVICAEHLYEWAVLELFKFGRERKVEKWSKADDGANKGEPGSDVKCDERAS